MGPCNSMLATLRHVLRTPPFEKGGLGGICFSAKQSQIQIPLIPPLQKGEDNTPRGLGAAPLQKGEDNTPRGLGAAPLQKGEDNAPRGLGAAPLQKGEDNTPRGLGAAPLQKGE